jgi:hypothetical protein
MEYWRKGFPIFHLANDLSALYSKDSEENSLLDAIVLVVPK